MVCCDNGPQPIIQMCVLRNLAQTYYIWWWWFEDLIFSSFSFYKTSSSLSSFSLTALHIFLCISYCTPMYISTKNGRLAVTASRQEVLIQLCISIGRGNNYLCGFQNKFNIFEKTALIMRFVIYSPCFSTSIFFPQGLEGKSILELDSGVRFSPSLALGQKHDLWHQSSSSGLNSLLF